MFKELESTPDLSEKEKKTIKFWEDKNIPGKLKELRKNSPEKVYYDGPITANNYPHYGHMVGWTLKDVIPRYWSMKNNYVSRNMGWDCQGLPVELEVEKALGIEDKEEIISYGIQKFNKLCKESVLKYKDAIFKYEKRIGRWFDENDMYYTMSNDFIESVWWAVSELYKKDLLYEGYFVVPYSTGGGCTLSHSEVNEGGYEEIEDMAITVKFKKSDEENTYFLAWTTTTWTIPGNLLLAIGRKVDYVKVKSQDAFYILAESRLDDVFKDIPYKIIQKVDHENILGSEYKPVFDYFEDKKSEGCFKVVYADHANDEEGTGIVHLAPYGEEDFNVFMEKGIRIFDYLNDTAHFNNLIPKYSGKYYKEAEQDILNDLENKNFILQKEQVIHRVAVCYRTKTPLIHKPIKSWYLAVTKIKDRMLQENQKVNWVPDHIKNGLSKAWISSARDWALSRNRYWGTPFPVWVNDVTGEIQVLGSYAEVEQKSGIKIKDPHKPSIDEITWEGAEGGTFRRINDVIDVWFDSGCVPFAKIHYPFENKDVFKKKYPAEYIAEGFDQVRLWFYTMHVLGVALFDQIPYENVVTNGMMTDEEGNKLSKSLKNFPPLDDVLEEYGADVLRLYLTTTPIAQGEQYRFSEAVLDDIKKRFFLPLWNSVRYFVMYANVNGFEPSLDYPESQNDLDKWILARLQTAVNNVTEYLDEYKIMSAGRELTPLIQDLSTWYVRRSRDRIRDGDQQALQTYYYVLYQITLLIAPFVPFISEEFFELLKFKDLGDPESVHLALYPEKKDLTGDQESLLTFMKNTRDIVSLALSIRVEEGIKIRQPLKSLYIKCLGESEDFINDLIKDEVNIREIEVIEEDKNLPNTGNESFKVFLDTHISDELKLEGDYRDLTRSIQRMRKKAGLGISDEINIVLEDTSQNREIVHTFEEEFKEKIIAQKITFGQKTKVTKI